MGGVSTFISYCKNFTASTFIKAEKLKVGEFVKYLKYLKNWHCVRLPPPGGKQLLKIYYNYSI